jgi:hypothetical protein
VSAAASGTLTALMSAAPAASAVSGAFTGAVYAYTRAAPAGTLAVSFMFPAPAAFAVFGASAASGTIPAFMSAASTFAALTAFRIGPYAGASRGLSLFPRCLFQHPQGFVKAFKKFTKIIGK